MRRRGLFGDDVVPGGEDGSEELEFGYCFDVSPAVLGLIHGRGTPLHE